MDKLSVLPILSKLQKNYTQPENRPRRIIDARNKEKFFMDDLYLNGYARHCGPKATLVYLSLCRHASKIQSCWPSQILIAKELGLCRKTVYSALKILQKWGIIDIEVKRASGGEFLESVYHLRDKGAWDTMPEKRLNKR